MINRNAISRFSACALACLACLAPMPVLAHAPSHLAPKSRLDEEMLARMQKEKAEHDLLHAVVESADFYTYSPIGQVKMVYHDLYIGLIAKVLREINSEEEQRLENTYRLAKDRLGNIAARTAILRNVTVRLDGQRRKVAMLKVQEKTMPLDKRLRYLMARMKDLQKQGKPRESQSVFKQAQEIINRFVQLQHEMWGRGVFDTDAKLVNYGLDRQGRMLILDLERLIDYSDPDADVDIMQFNDTNIELLKKISPRLAKHYENTVSWSLSQKTLNMLWDERPYARQEMQFPPVEEWIKNQVLKHQLVLARHEIVRMSGTVRSLAQYRNAVKDIARNAMKGHPLSHHVYFGLAAFSRYTHPRVAEFLTLLQVKYRLRRIEDRVLSLQALEEIAQEILARREEKEFETLVFVFETLILPACGVNMPPSVPSWKTIEALQILTEAA